MSVSRFVVSVPRLKLTNFKTEQQYGKLEILDDVVMSQFLAKFESLMLAQRTNKSRVAKAIGAQDAVVRRWGNGKSEPSASQLFRLARHLGVPMEFLADDEILAVGGRPGDLTPDEWFVIQGFREMVAEYGITPTQAVRRMEPPDDKPSRSSRTKIEPASDG